MSYDVVIVGAGPAGLAAACHINHSSNRYLVIDGGKALASRDRYLDVADGVAGAGLYSDGKHSFYPSATALWKLRNTNKLKEAYLWTVQLLSESGLKAVPPFPSELAKEEAIPSPASSTTTSPWKHKPYPSGYLSLEDRMRLALLLWSRLRGHLLLSTRLVSWQWNDTSDRFDLEIEREERTTRILTKYLLFCGGRLSPLEILNTNRIATSSSSPSLSSAFDIRPKFFRIEVGVRIELEHTAEFFSRMTGVDPKYILQVHVDGMPLEFRTFCCCRRGEIVSSSCCGIVSVSGRADVQPTDRSNIGFNVRLLKFQESIASDLFQRLRRCKEPFSVSLDDALAENSQNRTLANIYGDTLSRFLIFGIRRLSEQFSSVRGNGARLVGPCIEGVGMYPETDDDLRVVASSQSVLKSRCFVAGDANGKFRGIVAAFISGRYVASCVADELQQEKQSASL